MKKLLFLFLVGVVAIGAAFANGETEGSGSGAASLTVLLDSSDGWVRNFNPFTNAKQFTQGFMHEYLVLFDPMNNNREIMWLAEDIISEDDLKTITVKLRQDVTWSDGEAFNAEDVAYTYTIGQDHPALDRSGNWGENGKFISVDVVDEYTVKFVMREENRFHRSDIFTEVMIIPEHIWSQVDDPASYVYENPVVTGPFSEVKEFTPEMIVLGRNPNYWNAADLEVDELIIPQFNGNDGAMALLESGMVDWAHIFIPDAETTYVKGDADRRFWYGMNDAVRISFNYMTSNEDNLKAFNDPAFKRAASMAVDRQGIIDSAVFGYLSPEVPPVTGLPPALWGSKNAEAEAMKEMYTAYDLDAARQILADAGYADVNGDGYVENPDGTPIAFEILSPAGWSDWNDGCAIAAEGMQAIGINATAKAPDLGIIIEAWASGEFDSLYGAYGKSANVWKFYWDTIGDSSRSLTSTWWSVCQTNYINEDINEMIAEMPFMSSEAELKAATDEVEMYFTENMINIPLFYNGLWFVYNTSRFTGWSTEDNPVCEPALADNDMKLYHLMQLSPVN